MRLVGAAIVAAGVVGLPQTALASDDGSRAVGQSTPSGGRVEVERAGSGTGGARGSGSGAGGGGVPCSVTPLSALPRGSDGVVPVHQDPSAGGYWAVRECGAQVDVIWVPDAAPPAVSAAQLADQAARELTVPRCRVALAPPAEVVVVRLPTWFWLEGCAWAPRSATASVPLLSATVTATPMHVEWDLGDGTQMRCAGPGVAWRPGVPAERQSTYCSYAYARSSAGQPDDAYTVTATVRWGLSWSATNGEGGMLSPVLASSSAPVRVGEVQAIVER